MVSLILVLLAISPAGKSYSVDSIVLGLWRRARGKKKESILGPQKCSRWYIWLIRAQVVIVFTFATSTKIQADWMRGINQVLSVIVDSSFNMILQDNLGFSIYPIHTERNPL